MLDGTVRDDFLSEVMNRNCYNIVDFDEYFKKWLLENNENSFGTARINVLEQPQYVDKLVKWGWEYICHEVEFSLYKKDFNCSLDSVKQAIANESIHGYFRIHYDLPEEDLFVLSSLFTNDRFHLDDKIHNDLALKIKRRWIKNGFSGELKNRKSIYYFSTSMIDLRDFSYTSRVPVFLFVKEKYGSKQFDRSAIIDLIANNRNLTGGLPLASFLINEALYLYNTLTAKTQLNNKKAIKFYTKLGFKPINHYMVFHKHD